MLSIESAIHFFLQHYYFYNSFDDVFTLLTVFVIRILARSDQYFISERKSSAGTPGFHRGSGSFVELLGLGLQKFELSKIGPMDTGVYSLRLYNVTDKYGTGTQSLSSLHLQYSLSISVSNVRMLMDLSA